jgi:hypothetical protein
LGGFYFDWGSGIIIDIISSKSVISHLAPFSKPLRVANPKLIAKVL